jgi:HEAT repeat protein
MKRAFLHCALLVVFGGGIAAQEPQIAWEADFDGALKAAKADGKPLFIAFIMDDESANDEIARNHFHDKEIVAESTKFHCIIGSVGIHAATSTDKCPRVGAVPCASHQNCEARARTAYIKSSQASAPQFIFVKPDGETILVRSVWAIGPGELLKKMKLALGFNDVSSASDEVKRQREEAERVMVEADGNNAVKRQSALARLSTLDDPRIIDFLAKQTAESVDEPRRIEAVDAMGSRGNAKALPVLLKLLSSSSNQIRNHATVALEKLGMMEAGPALYATLKKEQKDHLRANLVRALAVCDPMPPDHMKIIIAMIGAGSQVERISAIRASFDVPIKKNPMGDNLKKALLAAAKDATAQIRGAAYYALARRQVPEAVPIIEKGIPSEKVKEVKQLAESALSMLKQTEYDGPNADDLMKTWLLDEDLRKE